MSDDDVVEAAMGRGVLRRLTRWATTYEGGCGHGPQLTRPGESRSRCWDCILASPGTWTTSACDVCGAYAPSFDRTWAIDPRQAGGVLVAFGLCDTCSHRELTPMEDEMRGPCEMCRFGLKGGHRLRQTTSEWFHDDCVNDSVNVLLASGEEVDPKLEAFRSDPAVLRTLRILSVRERFARLQRGAA